MFTEPEVVVMLVETMRRTKMTQEQLAEAIGISKGLLSDVLSGNRAPRGRVLDYLGLELITLYKKK